MLMLHSKMWRHFSQIFLFRKNKLNAVSINILIFLMEKNVTFKNVTLKLLSQFSDITRSFELLLIALNKSKVYTTITLTYPMSFLFLFFSVIKVAWKLFLQFLCEISNIFINIYVLPPMKRHFGTFRTIITQLMWH